MGVVMFYKNGHVSIQHRYQTSQIRLQCLDSLTQCLDPLSVLDQGGDHSTPAFQILMSPGDCLILISSVIIAAVVRPWVWRPVIHQSPSL